MAGAASIESAPLKNAIEDALYPHPIKAAPPALIKTDICYLPSYYDVSGLCVASMGAAFSEALLFYRHTPKSLLLSQHLSSHWFGFAADICAHSGQEMPPLWDKLSGLYRVKNGWIRLHTNAPAHRAAALQVLQNAADKEAAIGQVRDWDGIALEAAIIAAGGCAAYMYQPEEWAAHPQGKAVAQQPLIIWQEHEARPPMDKLPARPLRVLDCTRILAGPVCTRFLGGLGMDVLRLDPPDWSEPSIDYEITRGKRCATLDLKTPAGKERFLELLRDADIFVHGLRPDALDALGLGADIRHAHNPDYIDVSLNAYGWGGPWQKRRGFDSLVQMSAGIAAYGMAQSGQDEPTPLPVQALDHATGYLMAASILRALRIKQASGKILSARLSLARTALLLAQTAQPQWRMPLCAGVRDSDYGTEIKTDLAGGRHLSLRHLHTPLNPPLNMSSDLDGQDILFNLDNCPPKGLHSASANWL